MRVVRLREYDEALQLLEGVSADAGRLPAARMADLQATRAAAYLARRDFDRVTEAIDAAPDGAFSSPELALIAARLAEENSQLAKAESLLREAVVRYPGAPRLFMRLSDVLAQSGRAAEADAERQRGTALQQALTEFAELHQQAIAEPDNLGLRLRLSKTAEQLHRLDLAEMWLRAALGMDPQSKEVVAAVRSFQTRHPERAGPW